MEKVFLPLLALWVWVCVYVCAMFLLLLLLLFFFFIYFIVVFCFFLGLMSKTRFSTSRWFPCVWKKNPYCVNSMRIFISICILMCYIAISVCVLCCCYLVWWRFPVKMCSDLSCRFDEKRKQGIKWTQRIRCLCLCLLPCVSVAVVCVSTCWHSVDRTVVQPEKLMRQTKDHTQTISYNIT